MRHPLKFNNRFFNQLPADKVTANYTRQVLGACYSSVSPIKVASPKLVSVSLDCADLLDLDSNFLHTDEFLQAFSGNCLLTGMQPYASCYGGHQFGQWAGQLGDGRAINLGEVLNNKKQHWTLQLKGAGPTPYSRHADGYAVLRSSLREYLCSEAMHFLGIPTTRALSLILTGNEVERDVLYDGHSAMEAGAVVCRVAPSFTRFGHFQLFSRQADSGLLKQFTDFTIDNDFPEIAILRNQLSAKELYLKWFALVCSLSCKTTIHWMRVGFVHGVLNTDNMSILGLTIDYGPYGWLEAFDGNWTPNTTDAAQHRYAFAKQPEIVQWNLLQLANAILPLINEAEPLELILRQNAINFRQQWQLMMLNKLGLTHYNEKTDSILIENILELLAEVETDMTIFFRKLSCIHQLENRQHFESLFKQNDSINLTPFLNPAYYQPNQLDTNYFQKLNQFIRLYLNRCDVENQSSESIFTLMNRTNPKYIFRNYLAHETIEKTETGDFSMIEELLQLLKNPYHEQPNFDHYAQLRPEWARHKIGCSMLSCSS